jgi:uncharacterized protein YbjT (DUF2867 family)
MILVVGATGVVGGMVTRRLLEQGEDVRVLVRRDSPSAQLVHHGLATSAESLIDGPAPRRQGGAHRQSPAPAVRLLPLR